VDTFNALRGVNTKTSLKVAFIVSFSALAAACGVIGPSCNDESGSVFRAAGEVPAGGVTAYTVVSPKNSNLIVRLTWPDTSAALGMRATITACGEHTGCRHVTSTPTFGPGGPSVPQPWPPGLREMLVDGSKGKAYRVEVTGDELRDASFTLDVSYQIRCER
jgi:hypothetical protein